MIRGEREPLPGDFLEWSYRFWAVFIEVHGSSRGPLARQEVQKWKDPPVGSVKINVDADTLAEMKVWSTATVGRDHLGSCVGVRSAMWERSFTRLVGELMAIGEGLRLDFELGFKYFSVESDCLQTVNLVNKDEVDCNDLEGLIRSFN